MSKKQEFINYVETLITFSKNAPDIAPSMTEGAKMYWEAFKNVVEEDKPLFTDNGKLILNYMKEHQEVPMMKAKDIAEGMFVSSRMVSGALRKLVSDGYVEKVGQDPVIYALTDNGKNIKID